MGVDNVGGRLPSGDVMLRFKGDNVGVAGAEEHTDGKPAAAERGIPMRQYSSKKIPLDVRSAHLLFCCLRTHISLSRENSTLTPAPLFLAVTSCLTATVFIVTRLAGVAPRFVMCFVLNHHHKLTFVSG